MTKKSLLPFALGLLVLPLFGLGCNPFQSAQDRIASGIISGATGGKVTVDSQGNKIEFKDVNGQGTVTMGGSEAGVPIPSDFPSDVPVYPGSKAIVVVNTTADHTASLSLQTDDSTDKVLNWYVDQFKTGWKQEASMNLGDGQIRMYSKDKVRIQIMISLNKDENKTTIIVTRTEEK